MNKILEICTAVLPQVMDFKKSVDGQLQSLFCSKPQWGQRDRVVVTDAVYHFLRYRLRYEWLAGGKGDWRRLAFLALNDSGRFQISDLCEQELLWFKEAQLKLQKGDLPWECHHNLPQWLCLRLEKQLGENEFEAWLVAQEAPIGFDLRVNTHKAKLRDVQKKLLEEGVPLEATAYSPMGLRLAKKMPIYKWDTFLRGEIEVQNEGSQLLSLLVAPKRGEIVVDFCAGAGGKTLALGAAMRGEGSLYAFDISQARLDELKARLPRSGLTHVQNLTLSSLNDARLLRLTGRVDRVLVDAPCSGLGTLRAHPEHKWRQSASDIENLVQLQSKILGVAATLLKSGGRLVYATCSILEEENEEVAQAFIQNHPNFLPLPCAPLLVQAKVLKESELVNGPYLRLWPQRHQTDGFFAAVWEKK